MKNINAVLDTFISDHRLPKTYAETALKWFIPLAQQLNSHHDSANKSILIGVNGTQGSGKSTLTDLLCKLMPECFGKSCIGISIDDFYLSKRQRLNNAKSVHPLLSTRGVPGTHDAHLMQKCIEALVNGQSCRLPIFDKSIDDVLPLENWHQISQAHDFVILEGWCVGIGPQSENDLQNDVNELEQNKDTDKTWRTYVNEQLSLQYQDVFAQIDTLIMLKAPSFECVYNWRCEQEHKLIDKLKQQNLPIDKVMDDQQILDFIQYYQRLTEHSLKTLPSKADYLYELDKHRGILTCLMK